MLRSALILFLGLSSFYPSAEEGGRLLHLSGSRFSLEVMEPEGWELATRAALQIADFILYPEGTDWRRADVVIYVRFVDHEEYESCNEFIESSREQFRAQCPLGDGEIATESLQRVSGFLVEEFRCAGIREEMIAVTDVPDRFVVFSLTAQTGHSIDHSIPVLKEILRSFKWYEMAADQPPSHHE